MRILILILFLLFGSIKKLAHFKGIAHIHPFHIQLGHSLYVHEQKAIHQIIRETFEEIDHTYNQWNPNSDLSKGNLTTKVQTILSQAQNF